MEVRALASLSEGREFMPRGCIHMSRNVLYCTDWVPVDSGATGVHCGRKPRLTAHEYKAYVGPPYHPCM